VSLLGARNDLASPYQPGVDWGQLPTGRKWGSTASITTAPDGTIWVVDRCGNSGALVVRYLKREVSPIFQFEPSGKLLKNFGAGMFVSPHKLTLDAAGTWLADNGGHQSYKMTPDGRVLLTLGKKGGPARPRRVRRADRGRDCANGDIFVADGHAGGAARPATRTWFDKNGKFIKMARKGWASANSASLYCRVRLPRTRVRWRPAEQPHSDLRADGRFIAQWFQFGRRAGSTSTRRPTPCM
jgi:hypothetical protein